MIPFNSFGMSLSNQMVRAVQIMLTHSLQVAVLLSGTFLSVAFSSSVAMSQCAITPVAGGNMPDATGDVLASCLWDPDGSGPQAPVVVFGGAFEALGNALSYGLAVYDPVTRECSDLGGFSGYVTALLVASNNDLIVAGPFAGGVGGSAVFEVSRWDGTTWQTLGNGTGYRPESLAEMPNGDLLVGGFAGGNQAVTRWDGVSWTALGSGVVGRVLAMAVMPNGDLIAGGNLLMSGGVSLVRWDGIAWSVFAGNISISSSFGASVRVLKVLPNGDLLAAGLMQDAGGVSANGIARWDGATWTSYGSGTLAAIYSVVVAPNGDLLVGGAFGTIGNATAIKVARWDGAAWLAIGNGLGVPPGPFGGGNSVRALQRLPNGDLVAGGSFGSEGGDADRVARWNGTEWGQLRPGTGGAVLVSTELANGDLVVGGEFTRVEGVSANYVARRVNGVWQPLGSGADEAVEALLEMPNGDLLVGGRFTNIGGIMANHIARWDGTAWHAIGAGLPGSVHSLAIDSGGQILAAGQFVDHIAVWDGLAWNGTGLFWFGLLVPRASLLTLPDGSVLATAASLGGSSYLRRWTGFGWQQEFAGIYVVGPFAAHANGDLVIASGYSVYYWDGTSLNRLGLFFDAFVNAVLILPNGDVLAAGAFTSNEGVQMRGVARWDGATWSEEGGGTVGSVVGLRWQDDGTVAVVGGFTSIGAVATASFAELTTSCQATAVTQGAGCVGSAGLNVLAATTLPWLGAGYRSVATGMPANGIAVQVLGLGAASQTIASIVPQGVAGCVLWTTPDILDFAVPSAGEFAMTLSIPSTASLIGATFRQQVVPLELAAGGAILAVTATNALELTIGSF